MDLPGWETVRTGLVPGVLGATAVLLAQGAWRLGWRWLRRRRAPEVPSEVLLLRAEAERVDAQLQGLTSSIVQQIDGRLVRLEELLRQSSGFTSAQRPAEVSRRLQGGGRWDPLSSVNSADRNRVVELASMGELPAAIADSVGLLRGEVDLILRLHKSSERVDDA